MSTLSHNPEDPHMGENIRGSVCKKRARFPTDEPPYCVCIGGECAKDLGVLERLQRVAHERESAQRRWDAAVADAIAAGFSERKIAAAAGVTGPRINQIKRKLAA